MVAIAILMATTTTSFARDVHDSTKNHKNHGAKAKKYTCPMHPEVVRSKPGKCPKCGMALVKKGKSTAMKYTCPMHPDMVKSKPGKCPECEMALVPVKKKNS